MNRSDRISVRMQARYEATVRGGPMRYLLRQGLGIGIAYGVLVTGHAELVRGSHLTPSPVGSFLLRLWLMSAIGCGIGVAMAAMSWWLWFEGHDGPAQRGG